MVAEVLNSSSGECINTFLTLRLGSVGISAPALCFPEQRRKYQTPGTSSRPCCLCRPCKHVASQLLGALLVAKLPLDQTSISSPAVLCCHLLFVPSANATTCLASGRLCPVLAVCPAPVPLCCDSQVSLSCSTATAQPNVTTTALGLWSPSTSLHSPEW